MGPIPAGPLLWRAADDPRDAVDGHHVGERDDQRQSYLQYVIPHPRRLTKLTHTDCAPALRDTCADADHDGVESYGWTLYDPRVGGSQTIRDAALGMDLTTEFVKNSDGSGWAVRVSGQAARAAHTNVTTSLIFHVALEGAITIPGSTTTTTTTKKEKSLVCERLPAAKQQQQQRKFEKGHVNGASCRGKDPALGSGGFELRVNADPADWVITRSSVVSKTVKEEEIWQAKSNFVRSLGSSSSVTDSPGAGNMHFFRFDFVGPFSATLSYRDEEGLHLSRELSVLLQ